MNISFKSVVLHTTFVVGEIALFYAFILTRNIWFLFVILWSFGFRVMAGMVQERCRYCGGDLFEFDYGNTECLVCHKRQEIA